MTGQQTDNLTSKLAAKQSEILDAAASLTQQQLQQHANNITQQCNAVLNTLKNDTLSVQSEASAAIEALKKTLEAAQTLTLTSLQQQQIRERLQHQISSQQAQALKESLTPLKNELRLLQQEAQNLSKVTLKGWLKPLLIGGLVAIGVLLVTVGGTLTLDHLISSRAQTLSDLQSQITDQRMTLQQLSSDTWGIDLIMIDGQQYIVLPEGRKVDPEWTVRGRPALKME